MTTHLAVRNSYLCGGRHFPFKENTTCPFSRSNNRPRVSPAVTEYNKNTNKSC